MPLRQILKDCVLLTVVSLGIYFYGNNVIPLTNPDEVFYSQTAKEMAQHQTWLVPMLFDQPQFEKPILSYWLLRLSDILFGPSPFAARFFPAIFGVLGVLAVYFLGILGFRNRKAALLSSLILMTSGLYVGLAKTVFTDMFFSVFIFLSFLGFYWGYAIPKRQGAGLVLSFIFSALAVLTKGPLGFLIPCLAILIFLGIRRELKFLLTPYTLFGLILFLLIALPWYVFCTKQFGSLFTKEFFYNDHIRRLLEAEHLSNDRWYFYPLSVVLCMFPWSFFVLPTLVLFGCKPRAGKLPSFELFLLCWGMIVFVIFQVAHSKLTSYIVPLFPAVALLTGRMIQERLESDPALIAKMAWLTWALFAIFPGAVIVASYRYNVYVPSMYPVFIFSGFLIFFLAGMACVLKRRKYLPALGGIALIIPIVSVFAVFLHDGFDPYVSSKFAVQDLLRDHTIENQILCSKFFARGVRYYSDKPVAVIDIGGKGYFSPHPIPYLNSDDKIRAFLKQQVTTFAILKKSALGHIRRIAQDQNWPMEVLFEVGDEYGVYIHATP